MKKVCTICKESKDQSEFSIQKNVKSGLYSCCKLCHSKYRKNRKVLPRAVYDAEGKETEPEVFPEVWVLNNGKRPSSSKKMYIIWHGMMARCYRKNIKLYRSYGAKGIRVEKRWHEVENFIGDMGMRPGKMQLDRINTLGNYSRSNCRWVTVKENQNNRIDNIRITFNGRTQTLSQWADELGMKYGTLFSRIKDGWSVERALSEPVISNKP